MFIKPDVVIACCACAVVKAVGVVCKVSSPERTDVMLVFPRLEVVRLCLVAATALFCPEDGVKIGNDIVEFFR